MKTLFAISFIICLTQSYSQNFNGYYISTESSYQDKLNPQNNNVQTGNLKIKIHYIKNTKKGNYILVDDFENTSQTYKYILNSEVEIMSPTKNYQEAYCFRKCSSEYSKQMVDIVIYYSDKSGMTLMFADDSKSQALKRLIKIR